MSISRISKLWTDRSNEDPREVSERRQQITVSIMCGRDVETSYTQQVALLTAAAVGARCFPGGLRFIADASVLDAPLLPWPGTGLTIGSALAGVLGTKVQHSARRGKDNYCILIGDAEGHDGELRITFDGWNVLVGPVELVQRSFERELCPIAGVAAASLAMSEAFMHFAGINIQSRRQAIGFSLWRPDLPISDSRSLGVGIRYLPSRLWTLGLGHLGQGFLWNYSMLPFEDPANVELYLADFDKVEDTNWETGVLLRPNPPACYKTRLMADWLEARGYKTRLNERRVTADFRCNDEEPKIAFSGFDKNESRRALAKGNFKRIVDCGLGANALNFDSIALTTWPNPIEPENLWPDDDGQPKRVQDIADRNKVYEALEADLRCGRYTLAGHSVGVPFVGTFAGCLATAELLRALHQGTVFDRIKYRMASPLEMPTAQSGTIYDADIGYFRYQHATSYS